LAVDADRIADLSRRLDLVQAQLDELHARFASVPRLMELIIKHEDQLRAQDEGGDFVEGL
jgi:hypothetical protein